jgi:hypothetical protein
MRLFNQSKKHKIQEAATTKVQLTKNIKKGCDSPRHGEDETTSLHKGNRGSKLLI